MPERGWEPAFISSQTEVENEVTEEALEAGFLDKHIIDVKPEKRGNKEIVGKLGRALFGCGRVEVGRCHPPLEVREVIAFEPGKSLVLVGPNGAGKSTFLDAIMAVRAADFSGTSEDGAVVYGKPTHSRERLRIARLNQEELLDGLEGLTVEAVLEKAQEKFLAEFPVDWEDAEAYDANLKNQESEQRIQELRGRLMELFKMNEFTDRKVEELSGGERTKLSLCMLLMSEPDFLILDEPTNHLDLESVTKLAALFDLYKRAGVGILSVSHVEAFLEEAGTDGVIELKTTNDSRQAAASKSPYTKYKKDRSREQIDIVKGNVKWGRRAAKGGTLLSPSTEHITIDDSPLEEIQVPPLLPGEVWVLSGNNGSGKTKLMESMANRRKSKGVFKWEKGTSIGYMPQFWPEEVADGSLENFFDWIKDGANGAPEISAKIFTRALRDIGFVHQDSNLLSKKLNSFSGGEQRLLWFVAISCFDNVDAIFLDEPTNHMDKKLQAVITKAIQDFPGSVVFSTHDLPLLEEISKNVGSSKGGTLAPKNLVFTKEDGLTTVVESKQNPADYMKAQREKARKEAGRLKI